MPLPVLKVVIGAIGWTVAWWPAILLVISLAAQMHQDAQWAEQGGHVWVGVGGQGQSQHLCVSGQLRMALSPVPLLQSHPASEQLHGAAVSSVFG